MNAESDMVSIAELVCLVRFFSYASSILLKLALIPSDHQQRESISRSYLAVLTLALYMLEPRLVQIPKKTLKIQMYRNLDRTEKCSDSAIAIIFESIAIMQTLRGSARSPSRIELLSYDRNRSQRKAEEMQINANRIDLPRYLSKGDSKHCVNISLLSKLFS